jgi:hypothetical protein
MGFGTVKTAPFQSNEKQPAGAEARSFIGHFAARLKPCPDTKQLTAARRFFDFAQVDRVPGFRHGVRPSPEKSEKCGTQAFVVCSRVRPSEAISVNKKAQTQGPATRFNMVLDRKAIQLQPWQTRFHYSIRNESNAD